MENQAPLVGTPDALLKQANTLYEEGRIGQAASIYRQLLERFPQHLFLLNRMAEITLRRSNFKASVNLLRRSLALSATQPNAWMWLGAALAKVGDNDHALEAYDRAVAIQPDLAPAHNNKAILLAELGRPAEALEHFNRAIAVQPDFAFGLRNRGTAFKRLERFADAMADFSRAIEISPRMLEAYYAKGLLQMELRQWDEAMTTFNAALAIDPAYAEAQAMKAELLLLHGNYREGWALYSSRRNTSFRKGYLGQKPFTAVALWQGGEAIANKTIVIRPEVGLGDFIMFVRYAKLVKNLGAKVILYAPQPLTALFASLGPDFLVVPEGEPLPAGVDLQCPIMDFPSVFGTTVETVPAEFPYLWASEDKTAAWRDKLGPKRRPRVGLVWSGKGDRNIDSTALRRRTMPFKALLPLLDLPLEFHALQKEFLGEEGAEVSRHGNIAAHDRELLDMSDTAALVAEMDLVISIDTSVAHLAGALGKPLWVMLPFASDYRWALGAQTPWYPDARLFRQSEPGDWAGLIREVAAQLKTSSFVQSAREAS